MLSDEELYSFHKMYTISKEHSPALASTCQASKETPMMVAYLKQIHIVLTLKSLLEAARWHVLGTKLNRNTNLEVPLLVGCNLVPLPDHCLHPQQQRQAIGSHHVWLDSHPCHIDLSWSWIRWLVCNTKRTKSSVSGLISSFPIQSNPLSLAFLLQSY
jgi:hypothetical protein